MSTTLWSFYLKGAEPKLLKRFWGVLKLLLQQVLIRFFMGCLSPEVVGRTSAEIWWSGWNPNAGKLSCSGHSLCEKCYIYKRMIESDLGKAGSHTQKQTDWIINCILHDTEKSLVPVCPSKKVIHIFQSTVSHGCCCNHLHRLCPFKPAYQTECNILFTQQFYITCHTVHVTRISDRV